MIVEHDEFSIFRNHNRKRILESEGEEDDEG
jgi:hypothetical protein